MPTIFYVLALLWDDSSMGCVSVGSDTSVRLFGFELFSVVRGGDWDKCHLPSCPIDVVLRLCWLRSDICLLN